MPASERKTPSVNGARYSGLPAPPPTLQTIPICCPMHPSNRISQFSTPMRRRSSFLHHIKFNDRPILKAPES